MYRPICDRYVSGSFESTTDTATLNHKFKHGVEMAMNREREDEDMGRDQRLIHLAFGPQSQEGLISLYERDSVWHFSTSFLFFVFFERDSHVN